MCFSPDLGVWGGGGGGLPRGLGYNLLMQLSSLGSSKMETSKTDFSDILTIQNHQISYIKHVLAPLYVFFTRFGCLGGGGGLPRGLGYNLLMQLSSLGSSKMETSKTDFSDILTIQNHQISYIKHVLAPLYVFFTRFGCLGGGGGSQGGWGTTRLCSFLAWVVPLPSLRCLAEGNRIFLGDRWCLDDRKWYFPVGMCTNKVQDNYCHFVRSGQGFP